MKNYETDISNQYSLTRKDEIELEIRQVKDKIRNYQQHLDELEAELYFLNYG